VEDTPRSNRPTPRTAAAVEAELRRRLRAEITQARADADGELDDASLAGIIARAIASALSWHLEAPEHTRNATLSSRTWRGSSGPRPGPGGPRPSREPFSGGEDQPLDERAERRGPRDFGGNRPPRGPRPFESRGGPRPFESRGPRPYEPRGPRQDFDPDRGPRSRDFSDDDFSGPRGNRSGPPRRSAPNGGGPRRSPGGGFASRRPPPRRPR
jgi:hypothetical protein